MVLKAPFPILPSSTVLLSLSPLVEVLGQRSWAFPLLNSSLIYRKTCATIRPDMGRLIMPMYEAKVDIKSAGRPRTGQNIISWPTRDCLMMMGGKTAEARHTRNIYRSSFSGLNGWKEMEYSDAVPWFSPRSQSTTIIFQDTVVVMGGWTDGAIPKDSIFPSKVYLNDVWVYADIEGVSNIYWEEGNPKPVLARGQAYVPYWIMVTQNARWPARSGMSAVEFKGRMYILGGDNEDGPVWDLWATNDLKKWTLVNDLKDPNVNSPQWQGRNSLFAMVFDGKMFVIGRVQKSFYNTFISENGEDWKAVEGACGLAHVEIQAVAVYRGKMMLFTVGCHDYTLRPNEPRYESAVPCTVQQVSDEVQDVSGGFQRENRVYYSTTGMTWRLSQRPIRTDQWQKSSFIPHPWSGDVVGEYRQNFKVLVHYDSLYLIGGRKFIISRDSKGEVLLKKGIAQIVGIDVLDVWISKGLLDMKYVCADSEVYSTKKTLEEVVARRPTECNTFFSSMPGDLLLGVPLE